jgi:antitoxin component of MazEF toxin-antitoxin module
VAHQTYGCHDRDGQARTGRHPAEIREQLGLAAGDQLHLQLAGTRLVIERPQDAISELRQVASAIPETLDLPIHVQLIR